jgi:hypothetical protein
MNKLETGFCIIALALLILSFSLLISRNYGVDSGYRKAYVDMHMGHIEKITQNRYPDLWIKYNVKNKEKRSED